jgi:hypothetical protein
MANLRLQVSVVGVAACLYAAVVGEGVAVVITNKRFVAYGVLSGWRAVNRSVNEQVESVSAEDYAALIVTNERMLNFNGESGAWGEQKRTVSR